MKRLILNAILIIYLFSAFVQHYAFAEEAGTITIPSINCKFDLCWGDDYNLHQHYAMFYWCGADAVANHYGSICSTGGQWKMENVRVGDKAYLEYNMGNEHFSYSYRCYAVMILDVEHWRFYHNGVEVKPYAETDLICNTCVVGDGTRNYVCFFERTIDSHRRMR